MESIGIDWHILLAQLVNFGILFGIGMALGGYCPGTAAAAVATGKIDGIFFIVGFLAGSGFRDYTATGEVCGLPLPPGLVRADRL